MDRFFTMLVVGVDRLAATAGRLVARPVALATGRPRRRPASGGDLAARRWRAAAPALVLALCGGLLACSSGDDVTASTTCDEYLQIDQDTRYDAAQRLGRQADGSGFRGPMAGLNLDYSCSESRGERTLGSIMDISG